MSKNRITLVIEYEGDDVPSLNFATKVLGCDLVSAAVGDAIADNDKLRDELNSIKGMGAEQ